jgi:hypothetical protein
LILKEYIGIPQHLFDDLLAVMQFRVEVKTLFVSVSHVPDFLRIIGCVTGKLNTQNLCAQVAKVTRAECTWLTGAHLNDRNIVQWMR